MQFIPNPPCFYADVFVENEYKKQLFNYLQTNKKQLLPGLVYDIISNNIVFGGRLWISKKMTE